MNVLQKYLDQNRISKYKISKISGISPMTLSHATEDNKPLSWQTLKVISAVAKALDKSPGQVVDDLFNLENN